jgi:hypothetical protein
VRLIVDIPIAVVEVVVMLLMVAAAAVGDSCRSCRQLGSLEVEQLRPRIQGLGGGLRFDRIARVQIFQVMTAAGHYFPPNCFYTPTLIAGSFFVCGFFWLKICKIKICFLYKKKRDCEPSPLVLGQRFSLCSFYINNNT